MLDSKGFTLVELIVVVAVIAVLFVIAIPLYSTFVERAEYSELKANLKIYNTAAQSAIGKLGFPEETIVWGDEQAEIGEWNEGTWVHGGVAHDILVTISDAGEVTVSFDEDSENYDRYVMLTAKYGT